MAHARLICGKMPHKAVPWPPAALYRSIRTGGSSLALMTSTKGGHCTHCQKFYSQLTKKHNGCAMQHLMTMYYRKLSPHALITRKIMLKLITGLTSQESHHIHFRIVTNVFTITGDTLYNDSKKLQQILSCLSHLIKIWFLVEMFLYI